MASWSWRSNEGQQDGLTLYQLQEFVRTGRAAADHQVRVDDGAWHPVEDEPKLARLIPGAAPDPGRTRVVAGVELEVDDDGRLVPPTPEQIAQLLAGSGSDPLLSSAVTVRKAAYVLAALLFVGSAVLVVALLAGY